MSDFKDWRYTALGQASLAAHTGFVGLNNDSKRELFVSAAVETLTIGAADYLYRSVGPVHPVWRQAQESETVLDRMLSDSRFAKEKISHLFKLRMERTANALIH